MSRFSLNRLLQVVLYGNLILTAFFSLFGCIHVPTPEEQMRHIEQATGLRPEPDSASPEPALTKIHNGYPVMVRWGKFRMPPMPVFSSMNVLGRNSAGKGPR